MPPLNLQTVNAAFQIVPMLLSEYLRLRNLLNTTRTIDKGSNPRAGTTSHLISRIPATAPTTWDFTSPLIQTSTQSKIRILTGSILTNLNLLSSKGEVTSHLNRSWLPKSKTRILFRLHTRLPILARAPTATLSVRSWSNCTQDMVLEIGIRRL